MPSLPQILELKPSQEIVFVGPFTETVTSYLKLKNPSTRTVCFKVKTTAPRRYCVRPNSGVIKAGEAVRIAIMLQPADSQFEAEKHKHKFMLQSAYVPDGNLDSWPIDKIWPMITETMDTKLKCVFSATPIQPSSDELADDKPHPKGFVGEFPARTKTQKNESNQQESPNTSLSKDVSQRAVEDFSRYHTTPRYTPQSDLVSPVSKSLLIAILMLVVGYICGKYIL